MSERPLGSLPSGDATAASSFQRSATISSAAPLKHKDKKLSMQTRDRFESLDLEVLLCEFRAVAEGKIIVEDEDPEPAASEGEAESEWLEHAGFGKLAAKVGRGKAITEEDIASETRGLTSQQVQAVAMRAESLNRTLKQSKKADRGDARELFLSPQQPTETEDRLRSFTPDVSDAITRFQDLSEEDQAQVQCLNLIQLTSILEQHRQTFTSRPSSKQKTKKKKKKDVLIFGSTLQAIAERDCQINPQAMENPNMPIFFSNIIAFLETHGVEEEGIFRKAGSQARIRQLRQTCEELKGNVDFEKLEARPHDVSALLKQFLRDLAEPLLTLEYIETFSATQQLETPEIRVYALQLLVMLLPPVNRACLCKLLDFLCLVASRSTVNKMGVANLAVVFAPTLFFIQGQKGQKMLKEVELQVSTASTLKTLLEHNKKLWNVPPDIIAQIRFVNESRVTGRKQRRSEPKRKSGGKKDKRAATLPPQKDYPPADVQWVTSSTETPAVRCTVNVSCDEKLHRVNVYDNSSSKDLLQLVPGTTPADDSLFECGGNIGMRKLAPNAKIVPLLRVNPGLSLVILKKA
eukprot:m.84682 g.84682  ORF g.84682 m.84682 type:complete len:577 (-) comp14814_c0_seq1:400-2130(-)